MKEIVCGSDSIYEPLVIHTMQFLPRLTLKLHTKCPILGTLSAQEIKSCIVSSHIHCYWSVSTSSFNAQGNIWGASDSIYEPLVNHTVSYLSMLTLKLHTKCQILGTLSAQERGMICCKERHPLLMQCFILFLRGRRKMGGDSDSIYKPFMVRTL